MKRATSKCFWRAHRLGQHLVGDVADQRVLERKLAARPPSRAAVAARRGGPSRAAPRSAAAGRRPRRRATAASAPSQKVAPDHRGVREQAPLERLERVQPRREQPLHGGRQLGRARAVLLCQAAHHLLGEQRVAARRARRPPRPRRRRRLAHAAAARRSARASRSRRAGRGTASSQSRRTPPQPLAALEQLVAREADLQHRRAQPLRPRYSIRSSMPSSAQWMSSHTSTSGRSRASPSTDGAHGREEALRGRAARPPAPRAARPSSAASMPSRRAITATFDAERCCSSAHSASASSAPHPRRSFSHATARRIAVGDRALGAQ